MAEGTTAKTPKDWQTELEVNVTNARMRAEVAQASSSAALEKSEAALAAVKAHQRDDAQLLERLAKVEDDVGKLPTMIGLAVEGLVKRHGRGIVMWVLGAIAALGTGGYFRIEQVNDASVERVEAVTEDADAKLRRLFAEARAEGRADRDAELEAARIAEARRIAAAERIANMRDPEEGNMRAKRVASSRLQKPRQSTAAEPEEPAAKDYGLDAEEMPASAAPPQD